MRFMGAGWRYGLMAAVVCVMGLLGAPAHGQQMSRSAFCTAFEQICQRTCPQGPGSCGAICGQRLEACRSSGCFHFNVPRPRCETNSADVALARQPAAAPVKASRLTFCTAFAQICQRTCPQGPGNCGPACGQRLEACRSSGCFHFTAPRPRCDSNPEDVALSRQRP